MKKPTMGHENTFQFQKFTNMTRFLISKYLIKKEGAPNMY